MNSEIGFTLAKLMSKIRHDPKEIDKLNFFKKEGVKFPGGGTDVIFIRILQKMSLI